MKVMGSLIPVQQGDTIHFQDTAGETILTYNKLHVTDANGTTIPAKFAIHHSKFTPSTRSAIAGQAIRIIVFDDNAVYPLTIDPWAQQAYLKASNTGDDDQFGYSVAVSGNTVVVGAPYEDSSASGVNGNQNDNSAANSGAAYVFTRSGAPAAWTQQAYLKASNTGNEDQFGYSVAVDGDTVVIGAPYEDSSATGVNVDGTDNSFDDSGAVYVFTRSGAPAAWTQQAYLKASHTEPDDRFGYSVAVDDDTVVVGAPYEDSGSGSGAAYVFTRSVGAWSQQTYLKASNSDWNDGFGWSVAVDGDAIVVGAPFEESNGSSEGNNSASNSGAAYIFARSVSAWSQQAYLKASNTEAHDLFGWSVAVSGNTVVVGAPYEDSSASGVNGNQNDNSASNSGAAYIFTSSGAPATWTQQAYLKASNTGSSDEFGWSVAVDGDTLVVGTQYEERSTVFIRSGITGVWSIGANLKTPYTYNFVYAVAVSGDTIVVGAPYEESGATGVNGEQDDSSAPSSGAAYVFDLAPDLEAVKSNDTGGAGTVGVAFNWTVTVSNTDDDTDAIFADGEIILKDHLPWGPVYGAPGVRNLNKITYGRNLYCYIVKDDAIGETLYCKANGGDVIIGAINGSFEVRFSVTPQSDDELVNPPKYGGVCEVDPDEVKSETNEDNNDCAPNPDKVTVSADPEMDVSGLGVSIPDGDTSPDTADLTDFGEIAVDGSMALYTFIIQNSGTADLKLAGTPVKVGISGAHAGDFTLTTDAASPMTSGGGTTTFTVQFDPSAVGLREATVSIANNDYDENPYNFSIQGTGTATADGTAADGVLGSRRVRIVVPGGTANGQLVIKELYLGAAAGENFQLGNRVYDIYVSFDPAIEICLKPSAADLQGAGNNQDLLTIMHKHGDSGWVPLNTYPKNGEVCAMVSKLSLFGLGAPIMPETGFSPDVHIDVSEAQPETAYYEYGDMQLVIPDLDMELPIVGVPLTARGWDVSWLGDQAGYLYGTAFPTWAGNTAITAHVWDRDNNPGPFVDLHTLQHGDQVEVHTWGQVYTYEVRQVMQVRPDDLRALPHDDYDVLTLITCQGFDESSGEYGWRLAVRAVLIDIE